MLAAYGWRQRSSGCVYRPVSTRVAIGRTTARGSRHGPGVRQRSAEETAALVVRRRRLPFIGMSLVASGLGAYLVLLYTSSTRAPKSTVPGPVTQSQLTEVYDRTAEGFDADVNVSEKMMGITRVRRELAGQCKGDVLEVSCGTARNLGYYRFGRQEGVRSLTLVDLSPEMVEQGKRKWTSLRGSRGLSGAYSDIPVRFWKGDVKGRMPVPPVDRETRQTRSGYSTIIQSMGLCSTDDPVQLLRNLADHLDPYDPDARILLLEHGRSYYAWWNNVLDTQAPIHADKHGCWWNRDIGQIVKDSGLEIVRERRRNFGTTWIFELRTGNEAMAIEGSQVSQAGDEAVAIDGSQESSQATSGGSPGETESSTGSSLAGWLPRWTHEKICKR